MTTAPLTPDTVRAIVREELARRDAHLVRQGKGRGPIEPKLDDGGSGHPDEGLATILALLRDPAPSVNSRVVELPGSGGKVLVAELDRVVDCAARDNQAGHGSPHSSVTGTPEGTSAAGAPSPAAPFGGSS